MTYNLTDTQKELARQIVKLVREKAITETFVINWQSHLITNVDNKIHNLRDFPSASFERGSLSALAEAKLLVSAVLGPNGSEQSRRCTLTALAFIAVDSDFREEKAQPSLSATAQSLPSEISVSFSRLREKYPDPKRLGFLIMRFAAEKPYEKIVEAIKQTGEKHGLTIVRADETEFHADLWGNVQTYLHGCGFGIAVYERIQTDEPNANVGLEVGYLMAMKKPVLLLKDKTAATLQSDLAGKLYKQFDPHDPEGTIPGQLTKWLEDYGVIVRKRASP